MKRVSRRILLVHPPYGDLTYPYHSLSYVAAPLLRAGYEVDIVDLNALWFRSVFTSGRVRRWKQQLTAEFDALNRRPSLDLAHQERAVQVLKAISLCDDLEPERTVETFRSEEFYDFATYQRARSQVRAFENLLSDLYASYNFFTAFALPPYEANAASLVSRAAASRELIADFKGLLEERFGGRDYLFCGVSFPFSAQLLPGFAALRALRDLFPDAVHVAGGTAISDIYKYRRSAQALSPFQALCDCFYIGEAETEILAFAEWCSGGRSAPPSQVINLAASEVIVPEGQLAYIALANDGDRFLHYQWNDNPPHYGWIDWDLYLAPEKQVNYAPARGCFWNQCTFCDYGLNTEGPTAPSRTMDPAVVVKHLQQLSQQGIQRVYFAVDAISPKFLGAFAGHAAAAHLPMRWSSQFFLTTQFDAAFIQRLNDTGLSMASFGLESGSSRVLELMGKGKNRVEKVLLPVFDAFRKSSVGLQPLFFFGFPGETDEDRQRTVDLLRANDDILSTISKGGQFDLLQGSMVAKDPEKFGVRNIRRRENDDIAGGLVYELVSGEPLPDCNSFSEFNAQLPHCSLYERPWAGGIDNLHTQLYVERHGRGIFHECRDSWRDYEWWGEIQVHSAFDLDEVLENVVAGQVLTSSCTVEQLEQQGAGDLVSQVLAPVEPDDSAHDYAVRFRHYKEI